MFQILNIFNLKPIRKHTSLGQQQQQNISNLKIDFQSI